ncbi:P-selectin-like [Halichondria panicea]|uniref:P-selectin-like n=1 Tax=Halichondria panicea TaxID=6063 RepID=UPI00312B8EE1
MIMYSAGSPGNRPFSSSVTYTCNPGYTLNGGTIRVCVSDGVWSGLAPVCQQITCPDLVLPTLMVSYNGGSPDIRPVDTGATYSCSNGYTLTGGDITRVCVSGGSWSGSPPTCQGPTEPPPTTCPDLTVPTNGVIIYSPTTTPRLEGAVATQICLNGYGSSTTSTATRVCLSN